MSHYDTLGLEKGATTADVRKAWQRESSKHHPDRGGKTEDMARINVAYEVLSDPERRKRYDETGSDAKPGSMEQQVESLFMQFATEVVDDLMKNPGANPLSLFNQKLDQGQEMLHKAIAELDSQHAKLSKQLKRTRMKKKDRVNLIDQVIEHKLGLLDEKRKTQLPAMLKMIGEVRKLLPGYEYIQPETPAPGQQQGPTTIFTSPFHNVFGRR